MFRVKGAVAPSAVSMIKDYLESFKAASTEHERSLVCHAVRESDLFQTLCQDILNPTSNVDYLHLTMQLMAYLVEDSDARAMLVHAGCFEATVGYLRHDDLAVAHSAVKAMNYFLEWETRWAESPWLDKFFRMRFERGRKAGYQLLLELYVRDTPAEMNSDILELLGIVFEDTKKSKASIKTYQNTIRFMKDSSQLSLHRKVIDTFMLQLADQRVDKASKGWIVRVIANTDVLYLRYGQSSIDRKLLLDKILIAAREGVSEGALNFQKSIACLLDKLTEKIASFSPIEQEQIVTILIEASKVPFVTADRSIGLSYSQAFLNVSKGEKIVALLDAKGKLIAFEGAIEDFSKNHAMNCDRELGVKCWESIHSILKRNRLMKDQYQPLVEKYSCIGHQYPRQYVAYLAEILGDDNPMIVEAGIDALQLVADGYKTRLLQHYPGILSALLRIIAKEDEALSFLIKSVRLLKIAFEMDFLSVNHFCDKQGLGSVCKLLDRDSNQLKAETCYLLNRIIKECRHLDGGRQVISKKQNHYSTDGLLLSSDNLEKSNRDNRDESNLGDVNETDGGNHDESNPSDLNESNEGNRDESKVGVQSLTEVECILKAFEDVGLFKKLSELLIEKNHILFVPIVDMINNFLAFRSEYDEALRKNIITNIDNLMTVFDASNVHLTQRVMGLMWSLCYSGSGVDAICEHNRLDKIFTYMKMHPYHLGYRYMDLLHRVFAGLVQGVSAYEGHHPLLFKLGVAEYITSTLPLCSYFSFPTRMSVIISNIAESSREGQVYLIASGVIRLMPLLFKDKVDWKGRLIATKALSYLAKNNKEAKEQIRSSGLFFQILIGLRYRSRASAGEQLFSRIWTMHAFNALCLDSPSNIKRMQDIGVASVLENHERDLNYSDTFCLDKKIVPYFRQARPDTRSHLWRCRRNQSQAIRPIYPSRGVGKYVPPGAREKKNRPIPPFDRAYLDYARRLS